MLASSDILKSHFDKEPERFLQIPLPFAWPPYHQQKQKETDSQSVDKFFNFILLNYL